MTNPDRPERDSLGPEIRRLRLTAGLTLTEHSTLTGIREPYLAAIEDGREEPSAPPSNARRHLEPVEEALRHSPAY
jgi:transcriptional regulator with XRE-family HTH domain